MDTLDAQVSGPDGLEERTAFYEEWNERDLDEQDVRDQLADELHDTLIDILTPVQL